MNKTITFVSRIPTLLALGLTLLSCQRPDPLADLHEYVDAVKSQPGAAVEPVPQFVPYEGFEYSAASLRSPFALPLAGGDYGLPPNAEPDFERQLEPLESQALSEMAMVGMLFRDGHYEALVADAEGAVHRVAVGNYLGRNHGRIEAIDETQLNLVELVPGGNGNWVARPQTLSLQ